MPDPISTPSPLERMLPARDPNFLASGPLAAAPAQRAQPWQPQQQEPAAPQGQQIEEEFEEEPAPTRDDFDALMALVASNTRPAAPQEPVPAAPAPAAAQNFALRAPQIDPVTISEDDFAKITESPAALSKFIHAQNQAVASKVFEQIGPAVQVAATAAVRSQAAETRALSEWFKQNPDFEEAPQDAVFAAVREAQGVFPNAPMQAVLFYAGRNLRRAMKQNLALSRPGAQATPVTSPQRQFAPSGTRPARGSQRGVPALSPAATAFKEMTEMNAANHPLIDSSGRLK